MMKQSKIVRLLPKQQLLINDTRQGAKQDNTDLVWKPLTPVTWRENWNKIVKLKFFLDIEWNLTSCQIEKKQNKVLINT